MCKIESGAGNKMAAVGRASKGLYALFKRGWHEIPEVMGSFVLSSIGVGCIAYSWYRSTYEDPDVRRYRIHYTVMRSDDPDVKKIKP